MPNIKNVKQANRKSGLILSNKSAHYYYVYTTAIPHLDITVQHHHHMKFSPILYKLNQQVMSYQVFQVYQLVQVLHECLVLLPVHVYQVFLVPRVVLSLQLFLVPQVLRLLPGLHRYLAHQLWHYQVIPSVQVHQVVPVDLGFHPLHQHPGSLVIHLDLHVT